MPYELLPHTADLRARVWGADLAELYASAVDLLRETLVDASPVVPATERELAIEPGLEEDERLFRFVRELLYLFDTEAFVPARVVDVERPTVAGESFDAARHVIEHQIKALTRHGFSFRATRDGYSAELLFDL